MSKQCPSLWQRRVFKNSFTRNGKLQRVKTWCVKIQHKGIRRTISLAGRTRKAAAIEAEAFYNLLLREGWVGVHASACPREDMLKHEHQPWPKTDARYWRSRLLRRSNSWSVRIEYTGMSHYFPLGGLDERTAAQQAARIYRAIVAGGWEAVCERFVREMTLAFHWAANPLAWTYSTVQSDIRGTSRFNTSGKNMVMAVVESDRSLQRTLVRHLGRHASVQPYSDGQEALREIPRQRIDLVLVNHVLPDMAGAEFARELARLASRLPILVFSTYEDSNQLFLGTPGGASAYLLKRTPSEHLLAPIEGLFTGGKLSHESISEHVREYFHSASLALAAAEPPPWLSLLTPREKQILDCLSKGYVDKEIAEELSISAWTVHGHVKKIFEKLEVHSRTAAVVKYLHK